jgi:hypothetical protein
MSRIKVEYISYFSSSNKTATAVTAAEPQLLIPQSNKHLKDEDPDMYIAVFSKRRNKRRISNPKPKNAEHGFKGNNKQKIRYRN